MYYTLQTSFLIKLHKMGIKNYIDQWINQRFEVDKLRQPIKKQLEKALAAAESQNKQEAERLNAKQGCQGVLNTISEAERARKKADEDQRLEIIQKEIEQEFERMRVETKEIVERAGAVNDKLIAALEAFGDKALVEKMAEAMAPLAILRNSGVTEVLGNLLKGTGLENVLPRPEVNSLD